MSEVWIDALPHEELGDGQVVGISLGDKDIAVYRVGDAYYATDDECTHAAARLSDGWLDKGIIVCPVHAGRFDVKTGKGMGPPITCDVRTYPTRILGNALQVNIAD